MPQYSQLSMMFPPAPKFTDANLPSLTGKVYIVTGAASGVGYQLAKILYLAGGTVYIAARSVPRCDGAIEKILEETKAKSKNNMGTLASMVIDLSDLRTVKPAAEAFMSKESRLDLLVHNAAIMTPPAGSKDKLGHDLEFGTNCLGPYLLTLLLEPVLIRTATTPDTPTGSVRIVWVVSMLRTGNPPGAMTFEADGTPKFQAGFMQNYFASKNGGAWLANLFADRLGKHGVLSVSLHPGLMKTDLQRHWILPMRLVMNLAFKPCVYGAYSELYAGFSPEVKPEHNGGYLIAWGRIADLPEDLVKGLKSEANGGTGKARKFLAYCDREINGYL